MGETCPTVRQLVRYFVRYLFFPGEETVRRREFEGVLDNFFHRHILLSKFPCDTKNNKGVNFLVMNTVSKNSGKKYSDESLKNTLFNLSFFHQKFASRLIETCRMVRYTVTFRFAKHTVSAMFVCATYICIFVCISVQFMHTVHCALCIAQQTVCMW